MRTWSRLAVAASCALGMLVPPGGLAEAEAAVCAQVKIEIVQELTLERQAFDAHMKITNGLTHLSIEELQVDVVFEDPAGNPVYASSDPNDTTAMFFITLDSMSNVSGVDGSGVVAPEAVADIHWLIIPAPGSAGPDPDGTLYYVGAEVAYSIGGEEQAVSVTPDSIYVRPMPLLFLDYFLTQQVDGDNPFTDPIELPEPFTLGVRVLNDGHGPANKLKITSGQPKIVENELGLLIAFEIIGSEVYGQPASTSLTVDFGDLLPSAAATARWFMTSTLQGHFVEFEATFSHADELGGELTSLMEEVNTHWLLRDVLVELPGRDEIRDFLADDSPFGIWVYESDAVTSEVYDGSEESSLTALGGDVFQLEVPPAGGLLWSRVPDPNLGTKQLIGCVRDDGKELDPANFWLSSVWKKNNEPKDRYLNVFDSDNPAGHGYEVRFGAATTENNPPVLGPTPDRKLRAGEDFAYPVAATDADGTDSLLSMGPLPAGAVFVDHQDGTGVLLWTPAASQIGTYSVKVEAFDGALFDSALVKLIVVPANATNSPPEAATAVIVTTKDTPSQPVTPTVVDADEGDAHFFTIATPPLHGTAEVVANQLVYTPDDGFTGSDAFTFEAADLFGESVLGEASATVTGINDLVATGAVVESDADGVPALVRVEVENTGVQDLVSPVKIDVRARTCGVDQIVGTVSQVLSPGVSTIEIPVDLDGVVGAGEPAVLHAAVDTAAVMPEPDEFNNAVARGVLVGVAPARTLALGSSGATPQVACADQAFTASGRTVYGLREVGDGDCYDIAAAGATVQYELEETASGTIVRSGSVVADANGAWHAEFGVPSDAGGDYELRATISDGGRADESRFPLSLEACAQTVPPMMVPEPLFPGPDGGEAIVAFTQPEVQFPWLVHPGMPIANTGADGSGSYGATTGSGSSPEVHEAGPAFGATGGEAAAFDAGVDAADISMVPASPGVGERVTFRAVITANDSLYGLPVGWEVTGPEGQVVSIAPSTWYYANGDLHVSATWSALAEGAHSVAVTLGPDHSDADAGNDVAIWDFEIGAGAPAFAGLTLWLEAGEGVAVDAQGGIFSWDDRSPAGMDAGQAEPVRRPKLVVDAGHGHPRVTFDGDDDFLALGAGFDDFSDGVTAFVVAQPTNQAKSSSFLELGNGPTTDRIAFGRSGVSDAPRYAIDADAATGAAVLRLAAPQVLSLTHAPDKLATLYRDGEVIGAQKLRVPGIGTRTLNWIGRSNAAASGLYEGGIYAVLLYDRILTDEERVAVELYLAGTYGLYHPAAEWLVTSGYAASVVPLIHANHWSRAEADAYVAWLAANPAAPVPGVGLELWLRGDLGVAADADGVVSSWADRSAAIVPYHAVQAVPGARPVVVADAVAGQPAIRFDGDDDALALPTGFADLSDGLTVFVVAREESAQRWASAFDFSREGHIGRVGVGRDASNGDGARLSVGDAVLAGDGGLASPAFRVLAAVHRPDGLATLYRHGSVAAQQNLGPPVDALRDRNFVGRGLWDAIGRFDGDIAEILIYDRALADSARRGVEAYLADRYGLYHAEAEWLAEGGYGAAVVAMIHEEQWTLARADAWVAFHGAHQGKPPLPAAGLELWLAGDQGVFMGEGDFVNVWADQSPAGSDGQAFATQTRPVWKDGVWGAAPGVAFDGHDDGLGLPAGEWGDIDEVGLSMYAVVRPSSYAGQRPVVELGSGIAKHMVLFGPGEAPGSLRYRAGTSIVDAPSGLPPDKVQVIGVVHAADGLVTLRRDGATVTTAVAALPVDALRDASSVGFGLSSKDAFNGDILEVVVHRRALNALDRKALEVYLAGKYGLYHPNAKWIVASGFDADTMDVIHANAWSLQATQAWLAYQELFGDGPVAGIGLGLWLRADEGVTVDADDKVLGWVDGSGAPVPSDASQAVAGARPLLVADGLGGLPVIRFDGQDDVLNLPPGFSDLTGGLTVVAVARPSAVNRWAAVVSMDGSGAAADRVAVGRRGTSNDLRYATGADAVDATDVWETDVFRLVSVVHEANESVALYDHGEAAAVGKADLPSLVLRDHNQIGGSVVASGTPWAGDLAELLVWTRALSDAERLAVEVHLADKYGLYHPDATSADGQ